MLNEGNFIEEREPRNRTRGRRREFQEFGAGISTLGLL